MKRNIGAAAILLSAAALLASCKQNTPTLEDALINDIVSEISSENAAASPKKTSAAAPEAQTAPGTQTPSAAGQVDIDLTQMNSTMIYSIIYDMMVYPENYYGKSLMVNGYFDTMYVEQFNAQYYFVVVPDATACCVQGLEFKLNDPGAYPDGYPEPGTDICVRGVLGNYEEAGQLYIYIQADQMTVLQ